MKSRFKVLGMLSILFVFCFGITFYPSSNSVVFSKALGWTQNSWVGGPNQTIWKDETEFFSETNIATMDGSLKIRRSPYWQEKADIPQVLYGARSVSVNGKIYLVGGAGSGGNKNTLYVYDSSSDSWLRKANMPDTRYIFGIASIANKIYVAGGVSGCTGAGLPVARVLMYDINADKWQSVPDMPKARKNVAAASLNGKLFVIGGVAGGKYLSTNEVYDSSTNKWKELSPMPTGRSALGIVSYGGKIYAFGGRDENGVVNKVEIYDPLNDKWTEGVSMPKGVKEAAYSVVGNELYVFGGCPTVNSSPTDIIQVYDFSSNQWEILSGISLEEAIYGATASAEGNNIYLLGGNVGMSFLNTNYVFDTEAPYGKGGVLTSSIFYANSLVKPTELDWDGNVPQDTYVRLQIRIGNDPGSMGSWIGNSGTNSYYTSHKNILNVSNDAYIQYKVFLDTTDNSVTPIVNSVTIKYVIPPPPPTDIVVKDLGVGGKVSISWKNPQTPDFSYVNIYRSEEKGEIGTRVYSRITKESIIDQNLENGVMYYYTLRSVDKDGDESINSDQYEVTPTGPSFSINIPSSIHVQPNGEYFVKIKIDSINGFTDPVTLQVKGLPDNVKYWLSPSIVNPPGESYLILYIPDDTAIGDYSFSIVGQSQDEEEKAEGEFIVEQSSLPDFSLMSNPVIQTVTKDVQAVTVNYSIDVSSFNNFSSQVELSLDNLPQGVSGSFSKSTITPGETSNLSLTVSPEANTGYFNILLNGKSGDITRSIIIGLNIKKKVAPDFSITINPPSQVIALPGTTEFTISVSSSGNFNSPVSLTLDDVPPGVQYEFSKPSVLPSENTVLTIDADISAPVGDYIIQLTGSGGGITHSYSLELKIVSSLQKPGDLYVIYPASGAIINKPSISVSGLAYGYPPSGTLLFVTLKNLDTGFSYQAKVTPPTIPVSPTSWQTGQIECTDLGISLGSSANVEVTVKLAGFPTPSEEDITFNWSPRVVKNYSLTLYKGWNDVSAPYELVDSNASDIFKPLTEQGFSVKVYEWDALSKKWNKVNNIDTGKGYWVHIEFPAGYTGNSVSLNIAGFDSSDKSVLLYNGWNMIGVIGANSVEVGNTEVKYNGKNYEFFDAVQAGIISDKVYTFDAATSSWVIIGKGDTFEPGKAYLIESKKNNVYLIFP